MNELSVETDDVAMDASAQSYRALGNGIEYRLQICLRPTHNT
jgi:hypothetical protein